MSLNLCPQSPSGTFSLKTINFLPNYFFRCLTILKTDVLTRLLTSVCPCWHSSLLDEVICRSVICQMSHASLLNCPTSTLLQHFSEFGGRAEVYSLMVYRKSWEIIRNDVEIEMRSFVMNLTKDSYRYERNTPH